MKRAWKLTALVATGLATLGGGFLAGRAWAGGIPSTGALTYSGTLEDAAGAALTGSHNIQVNFWTAASGGSTPVCQTGPSATPLDSGRFTVALPDTCTTAVKGNPNVWVEVIVDGSSLGRTKIGAVPYAVEAGHASNADNATTASTANAAGGTLATTLSSLPGLLKGTPTFNWSSVVASASGVETYPVEGQQTLTFSAAGYYRITLNAQSIHDAGSDNDLTWYIGGTAKRLDPFSQEAGANIHLKQTAQSQDSRQVATVAIFVTATAGQTLTLKPAITTVYSSGTYHQATFMYAAEYLGP